MKTRGTFVLALRALALLFPWFCHALSPSIAAIRRQNPVNEFTSATRLVYQVIFSEKVSGVDTNDFALTALGTAAGVISSVAGTGTVFYVTVTGVTGRGSLRLDLKNAGTGIANEVGAALVTGFTTGQNYTLGPPPVIIGWGHNGSGQLGAPIRAAYFSPVAAGRGLEQENVTHLATSVNHSLALTADGRVFAWGRNSYGQLGPGAGEESPVARAVDTNGVLRGQTFAAIAAGGSHSLALTIDGRVFLWGANFTGQFDPAQQRPVEIAGALAGKTVVAIATGGSASYALDSDSVLYAWGENSRGRLGNGSLRDNLVPTPVSRTGGLASQSVVAISFGTAQAMALTDRGQIYGWGWDTLGVLGDGSSRGSLAPVPVTMSGALANREVVMIATGDKHALALDSSGKVYGWGRSEAGELGANVSATQLTPALMPLAGGLAGQNVALIAAGYQTSMAVTRNGTAFLWGWNDGGAFGNNSTSNSATPVAVDTSGVLAGRTIVAAVTGAYSGASHSLVLAMDIGEVAIPEVVAPPPGYYEAGQNLDFTMRFSAPVFVTGAPVVRLAGLTDNPLAFHDATYVSGSGSTRLLFRYTVQPGDSATNGVSLATAAIVLNGGSIRDQAGNDARVTFAAPDLGAVIVDSKPPAVTAIRRQNPENEFTSATRLVYQVIFSKPAPRLEPGDFALATTGTATGAITSLSAPSGTVFYVTVTGVAGKGELRLDFPGGGGMAGFAGGEAYRLVSAPALFGWGNGSLGVLGNGQQINAFAPVAANIHTNPALAGENLIAVTCGGDHTHLLTDSGKVFSLGLNQQYQLGSGLAKTYIAYQPVQVTATGALAGKKVVSLATSRGHTLALTTEGRVYAWGGNSYGQLGRGADLRDASEPVPVDVSGALAGKTVVAVAAGLYHSLALSSDGRVYAWGEKSNSQLGSDGITNGTVPLAVDMSGALAGRVVIAIAASSMHGYALTADGRIYVWGNDYTGTPVQILRPTPEVLDMDGALAGKKVVAIAGDFGGVLALTADGRLCHWSRDTSGSLRPVVVEGPWNPPTRTELALISGGSYQDAVLTREGIVYSWGLGGQGQLGTGFQTDSTNTPQMLHMNGALRGQKIVALGAGPFSSTRFALAVAASDDPPVIVDVKPPSARVWRVGESLKFDVNFSGPVALDTRSGIPSLRLMIGTETRDATNVFGAGSDTLTFSYTIQPDDFGDVFVFPGLRLNGGLIFGAAGTPVKLDFTSPDTSGLTVDPSITVKSITRLSPGVAGVGPVTWNLQFSEAISGLTAENFNLLVGELPGTTTTLTGPRTIDFVTPATPPPTASWNITATAGTGGAGVSRLDLVDSHHVSRPVRPLPVQGPVYTNDLALPQTAFVSTPPQLDTNRVATFVITATDVGVGIAAIETRLDDQTFTTSADQVTFTNLEAGTHTFEARSVDKAGNIDRTPSRYTWQVDPSSPPKVLAVNRHIPRDPVTAATRLVFQVILDQKVRGVTKEAFDLASSGATQGIIDGISSANDTVFYVTVNRTGAPGTLRLDLKNNRILGESGRLSAEGFTGGQIYALVNSLPLAGWGRNSDRQLGFSPLNNANPSPLTLDSEGFFQTRSLVAMAASVDNSLVLTAQGKIYGWGSNQYGELGNGTRQSTFTPVSANGELTGKTVVAIAAGFHHSLALTADGGVYAWGQNDYGQAAPPSPAPITTPTRLDRPDLLGGVPAIAIAASVTKSLALDIGGRIFSWGGSGAVPSGKHGEQVPLGAMAGKTIISIAAGADHYLALGSDGTVYGWGFNDAGELGRQTGLITQPVMVAQPADFGGKRVVAISAGWDHSLALTEDGAVYAWGLNQQGQLGITSQANASGPIRTTFGKPATAIYANYWYSHALAWDGTLAGWGDNSSGNLGNGSTQRSAQPAPVAFSGALAGKRIAAFAGGPMSFHSLALVFDPADLIPPGDAEPPALASQPQGVTAVPGSPVTLTAKATGAGPLAYQWLKGGVPVAGATNLSLTLTRVLAEDGGGYRLFVSNRLGTATSQEAELVVFDAHGIAAKVITIAGNGIAGSAGSTGTNAQFNNPNGGYVDRSGYVYIADVNNHRIRRISPAGEVVTMAGDGTAGYRDGAGAQARFNFPIGVFVDQGGDIYVADAENNRIRKISPAGFRNVSTVAGSGTPGYANGPALAAQLNFPNDLVVNQAGDIFVTEFNNHTVRKITPGGEVITWAGNGAAGYADGPPGQSRLSRPGGIAIDGADNLYVTEWGNHRVRRIDRAGNVITLAGSGIAGYVDGPALEARFNAPDGIAVDAQGNVYVTESGNPVIRRIGGGEVVTVAGGVTGGYADGYGTAARFGGGGAGLGGIGIDPQGHLVVADSTSQSIRRINMIVTPRLTLALGASGLELSWPATSAGFLLEGAARLEPGAWSVAPGIPQVTGATVSVLLPWGDVQRYYRLRRP